jgi:DNA processing protein
VPHGAEVRDALALSLLPGVGAVEWHRRLAAGGSTGGALAAGPATEVARARGRAEAALDRAERVGAVCLTALEAAYPSTFRSLPVAPPIIWARGRPALAEARHVAIVGTRTASATGVRVAGQLATTCAEVGIGVVSGLALGIDGAAHRGALAAGGVTVAVLGTGVDVAYPSRHRALQEEIAEQGLLLSEVLPGERGHAGTFPQRNRLIAALAELTVVVEAGRGSGALITADVAASLGRTVAAVPGSVLAPECAGSNALLRDGALVVCGTDDVRHALGLAPGGSTAAAPALAGDAARCWDALQRGSVDLATLARLARLDVRRASVALSALELHGLVSVDAAGRVHPLVTPA